MDEDSEGSEEESEDENGTNLQMGLSRTTASPPAPGGSARRQATAAALQGQKVHRRSIGDGPRAALPGTFRRCIGPRYLSDGSCSAREGCCDVHRWCSRTTGIRRAVCRQKRATMELVVLAYNAVTELCDAQGDSQKT